MSRIFNFSAGPSMLPMEVLNRAAAEMTDYEGSGMSVMEMSHRSKVYQSIIDDAEARLRRIMGIPENYDVLFLQGGASLQFAMVPMNLLKTTADYVVSGEFSGKSYQEACKYGSIRLAATGEANHFTKIPAQSELSLNPDADYLHICQNNTIFGTTWHYIPETPAPIVADMSSCILSEPVDVSRYGLIYAGAQKNMAPAGLTVVILRHDLISEPMSFTPTMMNYAVQAKSKSMYNTPPCYQIYILKLVLEWLESLGGLEAMQKRNADKAAVLYDYLDESRFFEPIADCGSRSMMNVTFKSPSVEKDDAFVKAASAAGFSNLKGHRLVGHMRASIYNAMPHEGVEKLVAFMRDFEKANA
ncbi:MAG: 3-phosphoserine/phosphohydroxythreonine transaminase [Clostridiaceae bacterium]|nr:3-phosphoserine/phosphohydroxythreonine transaminase [Clostridiaceae bacterium]